MQRFKGKCTDIKIVFYIRKIHILATLTSVVLDFEKNKRRGVPGLHK